MEPNNNNNKIFVGANYSALCKKTQKEIQMFDVFAKNEVSLHFFMVKFDKDRNYFCYDTFFPHYAVPAEKRTEILEAGAIEVDREGEKKCIHDWHIKAVNHRFR